MSSLSAFTIFLLADLMNVHVELVVPCSCQNDVGGTRFPSAEYQGISVGSGNISHCKVFGLAWPRCLMRALFSW